MESTSAGDRSNAHLLDRLLRFSGDVHVKFVILVYHGGSPPCALLHGALASDGDLAVRFALHALLRVAAGTNDQP